MKTNKLSYSLQDVDEKKGVSGNQGGRGKKQPFDKYACRGEGLHLPTFSRRGYSFYPWPGFHAHGGRAAARESAAVLSCGSARS